MSHTITSVALFDLVYQALFTHLWRCYSHLLFWLWCLTFFRSKVNWLFASRCITHDSTTRISSKVGTWAYFLVPPVSLRLRLWLSHDSCRSIRCRGDCHLSMFHLHWLTIFLNYICDVQIILDRIVLGNYILNIKMVNFSDVLGGFLAEW